MTGPMNRLLPPTSPPDQLPPSTPVTWHDVGPPGPYWRRMLTGSILGIAASVGVLLTPQSISERLRGQGSTILDVVGQVLSPALMATAKSVAVWTLLMSVAATLLAGFGRHNARQARRVATAVAILMPGKQMATGGVKLRRRLLVGHVRRVKLRHSAGFDGTGEETLEAIGVTIGRVLGGDWECTRINPRRDRIRFDRLPDVVGPDTVEPDEHPAVVRVTEIFRNSLAKDAVISDPTFNDEGELDTFTVRYSARMSLALEGYRARLDNHLSQLLPGRWRGVWDLQNDVVRYERRPEISRMAPYPLEDPPDLGEAFFKMAQLVTGDVGGWDVSGKTPHGLVIGETGGGKTVALLAAAISALRKGVPVDGADPKQIELLCLKKWPGVDTIATTAEEIIALIEEAYADMMERYEDIKNKRIRRSELRPRVLILDEWLVLRAVVNRWWAKHKAENKIRGPKDHPVLELVGELIVLARAAKIFLLIGVQRPDADLFPGVRDNIRFRLALGRLSAQGSTMLWGNTYTGMTIPEDIAGRGMMTSRYGPTEAQIYFLPELDLDVPDNELRPDDAQFRRRLLEQVTAAYERRVADEEASGSSTARTGGQRSGGAQTASEARTFSTGTATLPDPDDETDADDYVVVENSPAERLTEGLRVLAEHPVDYRKVPATVLSVDDVFDDDDQVSVELEFDDGEEYIVDVDRDEPFEVLETD